MKTLGKYEDLIKFIQNIKPGLIVVSEFTLNALKKRNSYTRKLMKDLKSMGYDVEYGYLSPNDKKTRKIVKKTKQFSLKIRYMLIKLLHENKEIDPLAIGDTIDNIVLQEFMKDFGHLVK